MVGLSVDPAPMTIDDEFEPRLGRQRARGGSRPYLHRALAAANRARGGAASPGKRRAFTGSRIGRGAGVGRMLATRDRFAAFRQRRVLIKSRIVRLAGKGMVGARAHLRYLQRDGVTRDGQPGQLYGAETDTIDGKTFVDRQSGDRHQFRFIVSPEDGAAYDDLRHLTRRLMARMEEDLGTRLDWVAVDHFNTGHPHTHILLRGRDDQGQDLIIARDYLTTGMRERAAELVDLDLGPRSIRAIEERLQAEVTQERLTSLDRRLLRDSDQERIVTAAARDPFDQTLRAGRLAKLARLGLAEPRGSGHWRLAAGLEDTLRRLGERGDIVRTMQRAFTARGVAPAVADQAIYDPAAPGVRPIIGRLLGRGLADELEDRHYLLVEAGDGRTYYVAIGKGEAVEPLASGAIVGVAPLPAAIREVDRTIVAVAADNDGYYDMDAHLRHDPNATQAYAEAHVRRLEAMRRTTGGIEREPDGRWVIATDHLDRAAAYEAARARTQPVAVTLLSGHPLAQLIDAEAATWLDRELIAPTPEPWRDAGFGQEVRAALASRRRWLVERGFAEQAGDRTRYPSGMLGQLERRELSRAAGPLADELGRRFVQIPSGERVEGVLKRRVDLISGRFALVERSLDFTLVPWRPVLERRIGQTVSGIVREGGISWTLGRQRSGPEI